MIKYNCESEVAEKVTI